MTSERATHLKRVGLLAGAGLALAVFAWLLGSSLVPLAVAFVLAYLLYPLIARLERLGVRRKVAVFLTFAVILFFTVIFLIEILPPLVQDLNRFVREFPELLNKSLIWAQGLLARVGVETSLDRELLYGLAAKHLPKLSIASFAPLGNLVGSMFSSISLLIAGLINLFLIPVFFFYLIDHYEDITDGLFSLLPLPWQPFTRDLSTRFNEVLAGYLRGQVVICLILALFYCVGLALTGVAFGPLIGIVAGLANIIPYVGFTAGLATALISSLADFSGWMKVVGVVLTFGLGSVLEGLFLTPKIVGDKVGLGPLATLLALLVGGNVAGIFGMLVAIPAAGMGKLVLVELRERYFGSRLYS